MQTILRLDLAGQPRGWITLHEAITAYARGDVVWGLGNALPVFGGTQRCNGRRSRIDLQPIVALQGRIVHGFTPPLCNRTLFRRDDHHCLYCGHQFARGELTRDHVLPLSRGGKDRWENVVAACRPCNVRKRDRLLQDTGMALRTTPRPPAGHSWVAVSVGAVPDDWHPYLALEPALSA